jgi:hypothetical protein
MKGFYEKHSTYFIEVLRIKGKSVPFCAVKNEVIELLRIESIKEP